MALSTINLTSCGSDVAAMDDMTSVINLCLKHNNRAYNAATQQQCIQIIRTMYKRGEGRGTGQDKGRIDVPSVEGRAVIAGAGSGRTR